MPLLFGPARPRSPALSLCAALGVTVLRFGLDYSAEVPAVPSAPDLADDVLDRLLLLLVVLVEVVEQLLRDLVQQSVRVQIESGLPPAHVRAGAAWAPTTAQQRNSAERQ